MDCEKIQIGNYQWTSKAVVERFIDKSLEDIFFSWGEFSVPTSYTMCNGSNLAMRKSTITSQLFVECNFDFIDASDSTFIDCLFVNCSFKNANFHNANFIGTAIIQDKKLSSSEMFKEAGMSQTKFRSSNSNYSILSNLNFKGCGFRHSIFENVIFNEVSIKHTSFENACLNNCIIDCLDLKSSACRGIIINDCSIKKYISSLEKALGGIGTLQTLEHCDDFELYIGSYKVDNLSILWKKLEEISNNFILEGRFFEFINIMNYLCAKKQKEISKKYNLSHEYAIQLSTHNNVLNGYQILEEGKFLYQIIGMAYEKISENGKRINLDDILYSLKAMYFLNINEYILLKLLVNIYKAEMQTYQNNYSDFLTLSQINHFFHIIGERIISNVYRITFHNETASLQDKDDRDNFCDFCKQFIEITIEGKDDFKLISMLEGSIDVIFESVFNIYNILVVAAILGCRFEIKDGKISFTLNPSEGIKSYAEFIKQIASIIPLLGDKKITEDKFRYISKKAAEKILKLIEYIGKNSINGNIKPNDASKEIEETIRETRIIAKQGDKIIAYETKEVRKKISEH